MFGKVSFLALVLPLVHALQLSTPTNVASGGSVTITWTTAAGDPSVFSIYLVNAAFHDTFGIANNVASSAGTLTLQLPLVPTSDGYTLQAVNIANIGQVYSTSGSFSVSGETSTSTTVTSTTSTSPTSTGTIPTAPIPSASAFGTTVAATSTSATSTTGSGTATATGAGAASTNKSGAASPLMKFGFTAAISDTGSVAAVLLGAVAVIAVVGL